jgi:hypothetical protein
MRKRKRYLQSSFVEILAKQLTSLFSFLLMLLGVWGMHSCYELAKFKKLLFENQQLINVQNNVANEAVYEATPYLFNLKLQSSLSGARMVAEKTWKS